MKTENLTALVYGYNMSPNQKALAQQEFEQLINHIKKLELAAGVRVKVVEVTGDSLKFDSGLKLTSDHEQDCCESHYLSFADLSLKDFEGLEFDLSNEDFFERIEGYGIALKPIHGHPVRVPGYGDNNGYYSSNLSLVLENADGIIFKSFGITECQNYREWT